MSAQKRRRSSGSGFVFVWLSLACAAALLMPGCESYTNTTVAPKSAANEAAAISALRTIGSAQTSYQALQQDGEYGGFAELVSAGLLDARFGSSQPVVGGYVLNMRTSAKDTAGGTPPNFAVTADPQAGVAAASTGNRHFYLDSTGVIRFNPKQTATVSDPVLGN